MRKVAVTFLLLIVAFVAGQVLPHVIPVTIVTKNHPLILKVNPDQNVVVTFIKPSRNLCSLSFSGEQDAFRIGEYCSFSSKGGWGYDIENGVVTIASDAPLLVFFEMKSELPVPEEKQPSQPVWPHYYPSVEL